MNELEINQLRKTLETPIGKTDLDSVDPITSVGGLISTFFYTDIDNDDIRWYDFKSEKELSPQIINNPTCLEPINLSDLVSKLQCEFETI